jgi:hypothetical protein
MIQARKMDVLAIRFRYGVFVQEKDMRCEFLCGIEWKNLSKVVGVETILSCETVVVDVADGRQQLGSNSRSRIIPTA